MEGLKIKSLDELKSLAKANGIKFSKVKKGDLVELLNAHFERVKKDHVDDSFHSATSDGGINIVANSYTDDEVCSGGMCLIPQHSSPHSDGAHYDKVDKAHYDKVDKAHYDKVDKALPTLVAPKKERKPRKVVLKPDSTPIEEFLVKVTKPQLVSFATKIGMTHLNKLSKSQLLDALIANNNEKMFSEIM